MLCGRPLPPPRHRSGPRDPAWARNVREAWGIERTGLIMNHRKAGYAVLRVTVGMIYLTTSCVKFGTRTLPLVRNQGRRTLS